ncbi:15083_t:CDS:2, partial [Dentiscutata heterogama]
INPSTIPTQSAGPSSTVMSLNTPSSTRNLMGHCTSSAYVLNNHSGQQGIYFIFQDLSVRTEGTFTLKFSFCNVKELMVHRSLNGFTSTRGNVAAEVYSAPFKVYSAKKFPGMTEKNQRISVQTERLSIINIIMIGGSELISKLTYDRISIAAVRRSLIGTGHIVDI